MNPIDDLIICARCGRVVDQTDDEYVLWEVIDGQSYCEQDITGTEEQTIFEDYIEGLPALEREEGG